MSCILSLSLYIYSFSMFWHVSLRFARLCHVLLCFAVCFLRFATFCCVLQCFAMFFYVFALRFASFCYCFATFCYVLPAYLSGRCLSPVNLSGLVSSAHSAPLYISVPSRPVPSCPVPSCSVLPCPVQYYIVLHIVLYSNYTVL